MGQRHNQMGKLPEAVEPDKTRGSEELAVLLQMHDRVRRLTGAITSSSPPIKRVTAICISSGYSLGSRNRITHLEAFVLASHRVFLRPLAGDRSFMLRRIPGSATPGPQLSLITGNSHPLNVERPPCQMPPADDVCRCSIGIRMRLYAWAQLLRVGYCGLHREGHLFDGMRGNLELVVARHMEF